MVRERDLPAGATFDAATREFVWTPTEAQGPGSYVVTFSVTNGVVTVSEAVTITVNEVNVRPVLDPITDKTIDEGSLLPFTATATDIDVPTQTLIYSLGAGTPDGAAIASVTGVFTWTPTEAQGPNVYPVTINVTDDIATMGQTFTITVGEVNIAPALAPIGPKSVNEETELRFTISGSDVDVPTQSLPFSASGLPTGATFDVTTREFVWTPSEAQGPSTNVVTFSVSDGITTTSEAVTITITEVNHAPVLQPITNKTINEGSLLTFTTVGSDDDQPTQPLTYSLMPGARCTHVESEGRTLLYNAG